MKILRKVLFYFSLAVAVVLVTLIATVFLYKDRIIRQFIEEANKNLNTPITIGKIDVSLFEAFPHISLVFDDVYIEDSHTGKYPLFTAKKLSFNLNPLEVWRNVYVIRGLKIEDSETTLKIDGKGKNNYTILKETNTKVGSTGSISMELKNVSLEKTRVHYRDIRIHQDLSFNSSHITASIHSDKDIYDIEANGDVLIEKLQVDQHTSVLKNKTFDIESSLVYNDSERQLTIEPSSLQIEGSSFNVQGNYYWKNKNIISLQCNGEDADIQSLISLLPETIAAKLNQYQSKGNVYFKSNLNGEISAKKSPALSIEFGFDHTTIYHPEYKSKIDDATLTGSFASSAVSDWSQAALVLKDVNGKLNGKPFHANLVLRNFQDMDILFDFKGDVDASSLYGFYPIESINKVNGNLMIDIDFEGRLSWLKNKATARRALTKGSIGLQQLNFNFTKENISVKNLNGTLQFNNNDLALSNVSGQLGDSDYLLNGFFKNIITFLLFEDQPIGIETDLRSKHINLDQLFALGFGAENTSGTKGSHTEYEFSISRNINLNFNCDVKSLRYKKFFAQDVKGDLLVKNEVAVSRNLSLKTMGGRLYLSGIVDAKNKKAIDVVSTLKLDGIYIDSVFYVFENFRQTFIRDKHLKGQADADVNLEMTLNQNLRLFSETLVADISTSIKNGELNNFEPMKKLNRYLDDEGLTHLRFADLKNDIHIENKTIYIPQMEVRTNVTNIQISGTHTLDQKINYRVVSPLRNKKRIDPDQAFGAIEEDKHGQAKLFLKIIGTTDNYRVVYDTESVKKKITNDIQKEVKELREVFKNKGMKEKKEVELQEDEYFDWEANP